MGGEGTSVIVVAGPTASGKSALALALAERLGGGVINADSMQVYRELRVLTARPDDDALGRAPHFLYGTIPASERCSAGRWRSLALEAIGKCRVPIVVGGTGLYLKALMEGLSRIPPIPEEIRAAVRARSDAHAELARRDPASAARIPPNDAQRVARALEVLETTGKPIGEFRGWQGAEGLRFFTILLAPPREALYAACDARFARMLEHGAIEEVRALLELGLDPALPAMKALGVREIASYLRRECSLEEARTAGQKSTRNYVKRQETWFRHQLTPDVTLEAPVPSFEAVDRFLREGPS
jgi:tRNA dimethylallyltransferase